MSVKAQADKLLLILTSFILNLHRPLQRAYTVHAAMILKCLDFRLVEASSTCVGGAEYGFLSWAFST